jgi:hypothetical protein
VKKALALVLLAAGCRSEVKPVPRQRTAWGTEVHWSVPEIQLVPRAAPGVSLSALLDALDGGAAAWNRALARCAVPRLVIAAAAAGDAEDDGVNRVVVRAGSWCPKRSTRPEDCYDPQRQAITWVRPRHDDGPRDGEIREADVEINAVSFRWSLDGRPEHTRSLRAIVMHELGHVLGLAHACSEPPCDGNARRSVMVPDPTAEGYPREPAPTADAVAGLCRSGGIR